MTDLTQEDVVFAFAKAWNRLEPGGFLALLAPEARYASQWVFEELVGVATISDYLRGKMRTVRAHSVNDPNSRVRVEVGRTACGEDGRPCAFMTQGYGNEVQANTGALGVFLTTLISMVTVPLMILLIA